jgi:hypothetical protein
MLVRMRLARRSRTPLKHKIFQNSANLVWFPNFCKRSPPNPPPFTRSCVSFAGKTTSLPEMATPGILGLRNLLAK